MRELELSLESPSSLAAEDVHRLLVEWGGACMAFKRRCLWLVPTILANDLYARHGFGSAGEYLGRLAGLSPSLVSDVGSLHGTISNFPELWSLLLDNKVGWSKLRVLASSGLVTRDNAAWWAEQVLRLSKRELEELVKRLRMQAVEEAQQSSKVAGLPSGTQKPDHEATSTPEESGHISEPGRTKPVSGAKGTAPNRAPSATDQPPAEPASTPTDAKRDRQWALEVGTNETLTPVGPKTGLEAESRRRRIPISFTGLGELRLRQLHAEVERCLGREIPLGRVVEALVMQAWEEGRLPWSLRPVPQDNGSPTLSGNQPVAETARAMDDLVEVSQAGAAASQTNILATPEEIPEARAASVAPAGNSSSAATVLPRRLALEVILLPSDGGQAWMPWGQDVLPLSAEDTQVGGDRVLLRDLYDKAVNAAAAASRRRRQGRVPAAVRLFALVRSGGFCEEPGCDRLAREIHHLKRRAKGGSHHPDNIAAVCQLHHGMVHKRSAPEPRRKEKPEEMVPGQSQPLDSVDVKVAFFRDPNRSSLPEPPDKNAGTPRA